MFDFLARAADAPVVVYFTLSCSLSKVVYLSTLFTRETKFLNEQKDPSKRDLTHHFIDVFFYHSRNSNEEKLWQELFFNVGE